MNFELSQYVTAMKTLPTFYYLDHFKEMLNFIESRCWHLLDEVQQRFVKDFEIWQQPLQCTLVRAINRKSVFIHLPKFRYDEIPDIDGQLRELQDSGYLSDVPESEKLIWLNTLNKTNLFDALKASDKPCPPKSANKARFLNAAVEHLKDLPIEQIPAHSRFKMLAQADLIEFLQFLFFGNLHGGHERFSMRDLGIMRTREDDQHGDSHFLNHQEAHNSFIYKKAKQSLSSDLDQLSEHLSQWQNLPLPVGTQDKTSRDRYLTLLGKEALPVCVQTALQIWAQSEDEQSIEKWCRESYKLGSKEAVEARLVQILDDPPTLELATFAKDFYEMKYHKRKRSIATDMLAEARYSVALDEAFIGSPEKGIQQLWQNQGKTALRTENALWRGLFGVTFFELLYRDPQNKPANSFSLLPVALAQNRFYDNSKEDIHKLLTLFDKPESIKRHLTKIATTWYGEKNSIFSWSNALLERLFTLIDYSQPSACKSLLTAMCKRFDELKDGYPDLMLIDDENLSFVEVKAPNDKIRRNQIRTIKTLKDAGFAVDIATVDWRYNPEQKYCVVDIETTGGSGNHHRITEIAVVTVKNGKIIDTWQSLINPNRHIPRFITKLTGIDNAMVADAPLFVDIAESLRERFMGGIFVAHNVNFDYGFIKAEYERMEQFLSLPKLCTVREMRKQYPGLSSYSLASLCAEFDICLDNHHRAMDDAVAAAQLLLLVNEKKQQSALLEESEQTAA